MTVWVLVMFLSTTYRLGNAIVLPFQYANQGDCLAASRNAVSATHEWNDYIALCVPGPPVKP